MKFNRDHLLINLTSRKFLLTVASVVAMLANAFGADPETTERIVSLLLAVATIIIYILVEGSADIKKVALQILEMLKEYEEYEESYEEFEEAEGDRNDPLQE